MTIAKEFPDSRIYRRVELLNSLRDDLESSLQATVNCDERSLLDCGRRITENIAAIRASLNGDNSSVTDREKQLALTVKQAAKRLGSVLERVGEVRRARSRFIALQATGGYTE